MDNPFDDPRFPDRPTHPDYARLTGVIAYFDGEATEGQRSAEDLSRQFIDPESLTYMALHRARNMIQKSGLKAAPEVILASVYLDAFCAGVKFEQEGGTRPS